MDDIQNDIDLPVQNHSDVTQTSVQPLGKKDSRMANWLIKKGIAKDRITADAILLVLSFAIFGTSIYFYVFGFSNPVFLGPQLPVVEHPVFK